MKHYDRANGCVGIKTSVPCSGHRGGVEPKFKQSGRFFPSSPRKNGTSSHAVLNNGFQLTKLASLLFGKYILPAGLASALAMVASPAIAEMNFMTYIDESGSLSGTLDVNTGIGVGTDFGTNETKTATITLSDDLKITVESQLDADDRAKGTAGTCDYTQSLIGVFVEGGVRTNPDEEVSSLELIGSSSGSSNPKLYITQTGLPWVVTTGSNATYSFSYDVNFAVSLWGNASLTIKNIDLMLGLQPDTYGESDIAGLINGISVDPQASFSFSDGNITIVIEDNSATDYTTAGYHYGIENLGTFTVEKGNIDSYDITIAVTENTNATLKKYHSDTGSQSSYDYDNGGIFVEEGQLSISGVNNLTIDVAGYGGNNYGLYTQFYADGTTVDLTGKNLSIHTTGAAQNVGIMLFKYNDDRFKAEDRLTITNTIEFDSIQIVSDFDEVVDWGHTYDSVGIQVAGNIARTAALDGSYYQIDLIGESELVISASIASTAIGLGEINLNYIDDGSGQNSATGRTVITGGVRSRGYLGNGDNEAAVTNIGLNTSDSVWTGWASDNRQKEIKAAGGNNAGDGEINVYATNGAIWKVRPVKTPGTATNLGTGTGSLGNYNSYITSWNSKDGGTYYAGETGSDTAVKLPEGSKVNSVIDLRLDDYFSGKELYGNGSFGQDAFPYAYQAVDIGTLSGEGTLFILNVYIDGVRGDWTTSAGNGRSSDQAIIHSGSGEHYIYIPSTGNAFDSTYGKTYPLVYDSVWNDQRDFLILHLEENDMKSIQIDSLTGTRYIVSDDGTRTDLTDAQVSQLSKNGYLSFSLLNMGDLSGEVGRVEEIDASKNTSIGKVDIGLYYYSLATRPIQVDDASYYGTTEGTEWYLTRSWTYENEDNPDGGCCTTVVCCCCDCGTSGTNPNPGTTTPPKTPETPLGKLVTALGGTGAKMAIYRSQLDDLRKRLGEVRYGGQDGIWARGIMERDRVAGTSSYGFKQKWYGLNAGLDHLVMKNENEMILVGGNFKYGKATEKVKELTKGGGHLHSYGANAYATWANYQGYYADFVLTYDQYKQKMGTNKDDGVYASGKFDTWAAGASIEVGKMFSSTQNDEGWGPWYDHWWVEPQAQLSYYWVKGKNWSIDGMDVKQKDGQSLIGRLGVVVGKQWKYGGSRERADKRYAQAYLKAGVRHEFLGKQDVTVENVVFDKRLKGTTVYYGVGVDWNLAKQVKGYAQVERESGSKYKKDYTASVGLKWEF